MLTRVMIAMSILVLGFGGSAQAGTIVTSAVNVEMPTNTAARISTNHYTKSDHATIEST